ncbi:MAG: serine protease [Pseudomonadota bacterium]
MLRLVPDWIIYMLAFLGVMWAIFSGAPAHDAPPPPPEAIEFEGAMLPPASVFDDRVVVQVSRPKDGIGSAFAISEEGDWLTARHVVEGCENVALLVAPNQYVEAEQIAWSSDSDLALIRTSISPNPVVLNTGSNLRIGTYGYHVGYPQGRPGEAVSRLMSRAKLITNGEREGSESVLTWGESGRTEGLAGTLGGMSGGPVYDENGEVRGVIIAESPRRGRIYTSSPEAMSKFLEEQGVALMGTTTRAFTPQTYGSQADSARRLLQVVKVACDVEESR